MKDIDRRKLITPCLLAGLFVGTALGGAAGWALQAPQSGLLLGIPAGLLLGVWLGQINGCFRRPDNR